MGWTFLADSNNQMTLSDALMKAADNFESKTSEMFGKIDNMGNHWKGADYDAFSQGAHNYAGPLADSANSIRMFGSQFEALSGATEQLASELISIITNMTSGANGGGTISLPPGGGITNPPSGGGGGENETGQTWYEKIGDRYVDDWNDYKSDVANAWGKADGLISGIHAVGVTINETGQMVGDMLINTGQAAIDTVKTGANWLLDAGNDRSTSGSYWDNIGEDYAENWDFSTVDNFGEGVGVALTGTVRTAVDVGQTVINAVADGANAIGDGVSWLADKAGDFASTVGGWIFG